ncbi:hypothetical protein [Streptomyces stackebrandtii]|uniref:hypothetical protein n=1 Tax=Streptomyces stackebrandtii TaxID=3051177 RepID=UPI0028DC9E4E|nr:hypothetical protein [Streptomyces sp. DSM 40976]
MAAPRPVGHHRAAVRYRPAVGALNVCGDWYELVDLLRASPLFLSCLSSPRPEGRGDGG